jgi:hypothetical protein
LSWIASAGALDKVWSLHNEGVVPPECQISIETWVLSDRSGKMLVKKYDACCCDLDFSTLAWSLVWKKSPDPCCLLPVQEG